MAEDPAKAELSTEARLLAAHLHRAARGAARAQPYRVLAEVLRATGADVTERDIYELVAELQLAGRPVGTTSRQPSPGAFICETDGDFEAAEANLRTRALRPLKRLLRFRRTRREARTGQSVIRLPSPAREERPGPPAAVQGSPDGREESPPAREKGGQGRLFAEPYRDPNP